jgi:hypothetical protein
VGMVTCVQGHARQAIATAERKLLTIRITQYHEGRKEGGGGEVEDGGVRGGGVEKKEEEEL